MAGTSESSPTSAEQAVEKARIWREEQKTRAPRQRARLVPEGLEARGARRSSAGRSGMGVARRKANRDGDEADLGDSGRDAIRLGKNQRLDDRAVADGASAAPRAQRKSWSDADQKDPAATDALI